MSNLVNDGVDNSDVTSNDSLISESRKLEIMEALADDSLFEYHMLLQMVTKEKKDLKLHFTDISQLSKLPLSTVKRVIYGQSIPQITTFMKILESLGLGLEIVKK